MSSKHTVIVTGASKGIGAAVTQAFLGRGYNIVANSRSFSNAGFKSSANLALVEGDVGLVTTAEKIAQTAIEKFGSLDHVVCNAGIFWSKPFTDYTADDFPYVRFNESRGVHFHRAARSQADACARHRRQHHSHYCRISY